MHGALFFSCVLRSTVTQTKYVYKSTTVLHSPMVKTHQRRLEICTLHRLLSTANANAFPASTNQPFAQICDMTENQYRGVVVVVVMETHSPRGGKKEDRSAKQRFHR